MGTSQTTKVQDNIDAVKKILREFLQERCDPTIADLNALEEQLKELGNAKIKNIQKNTVTLHGTKELMLKIKYATPQELRDLNMFFAFNGFTCVGEFTNRILHIHLR